MFISVSVSMYDYVMYTEMVCDIKFDCFFELTLMLGIVSWHKSHLSSNRKMEYLIIVVFLSPSVT